MTAIFDLAPAIVLLPAVTVPLIAVFGRWLPQRGALLGTSGAISALVLSVWALLAVRRETYYNNELYQWAGTEQLELTFGVLLDPLSTGMLVLVALIATLVFVFSIGYMNRDPHHRERGGLPRYYASLSLFTASMLAFAMASNLLMAFVFFELVGLCSYLLIGFWLSDPGPASAAKKAFLVTRFGDYFLLVGVVGVLATFGTGAFIGDGFPQLAQMSVTAEPTGDPGTVWIPDGLSIEQWFQILGLLMLGGVIGKSAQFPLHTWLPDAMEGPTPVSALIHAATMVAAGVYLLARMFGFYVLLPDVLAVIALTGAVTALLAATMGVVKTDLKQVLAYSTISQYGYMMLGLGAGGYVAATFHLMTHAYFKALLFLGAGAIIVATHHQDLWELGGLKETLPVTRWTFLAGALALAGIVPFAGFWSKDEILHEVLAVGLTNELFLFAYVLGLIGVLLTGIYTFRMYFLAFHGSPRSEAAADPQPIDWTITTPLVVLGTLAVGAGAVNLAPVEQLLGREIAYLRMWLDTGPAVLTPTFYAELIPYEHADPGTILPLAVTLGVALLGAYIAHLLYNVPEPDRAVEGLGPIATLLEDNYYQDELQVWLATGLTGTVAHLTDRVDRRGIDASVDGLGRLSMTSGRQTSAVQAGSVSVYLTVLIVAVTLLLVIAGLTEGWWL